MNRPPTVDIFVEDRAHEAFLLAMLWRIVREENIAILPHVRSARGGHGRAVTELKLYQSVIEKSTPTLTLPDLLLVGIDGNCTTHASARQTIEASMRPIFVDRLVLACPDPHVERWFMADPEAFHAVIGRRPTVTKKKCLRDYYKRLLADTVSQAGHPRTLGGIEFANELVESMDLYRASRGDRSLKAFVEDLRVKLRFLRIPPNGEE